MLFLSYLILSVLVPSKHKQNNFCLNCLLPMGLFIKKLLAKKSVSNIHNQLHKPVQIFVSSTHKLYHMGVAILLCKLQTSSETIVISVLLIRTVIIPQALDV